MDKEDELKKDFYLFLDFDGVLNDLESVKNKLTIGGFFVKSSDQNSFNQFSIFALNYLIKVLEQKYNVTLVLSTTWRLYFYKAVSVLYNNGLYFSGDILSMPKLSLGSRSHCIMKFLKNHNVDEDFLIIDDLKDIEKNFDQSKRIKTHIKDDCLTMSKVLNYLDEYRPDLSSGYSLEDMENFYIDKGKRLDIEKLEQSCREK